MATPLTGTVIITGGNGSLGSEIALTIAKTQPLVHLLLLVREVTHDESVHQVAEKIRLIGPRSLEIVKLDLTSMEEVAIFARHTVQRVLDGIIPPIVALINSAATLSFVDNGPTKDGFDPVYQVNCLAPFLLTVNLLEGFKMKGSIVLNIGCSAFSEGQLDYFDLHPPQGRSTLSAREGKLRFGSSKLLMSAAMYALRRSLRHTARIPLNICTLDPGGLAGESHLARDLPVSMRVGQKTRRGLRPLVRMFSKSAINPVHVPAKVIAKLAFQSDDRRWLNAEPYYILDDVYEASSVLEVLRDGWKLDRIFEKVMRDAGLAGSSTNSSGLSPLTP